MIELKSENINKAKQPVNENKLSNPKVLNTFISCLKSLHKQQENKKKNYKKLMNLFSVRVQKYDDSSSHNKTDEHFKARKGELVNKMNKKKKSYTCNPGNTNAQYNHGNPINNPIKDLNSAQKKNYYSSNNFEMEDNLETMNNHLQINANNEEEQTESLEDRDYELECNSDSSIYTYSKDKNIYSDEEEDEGYFSNPKRKKTFSMNKCMMNERAKFFKHKFNKQMDQAKSKKFIKEDNIRQNNLPSYNSYRHTPTNKANLSSNMNTLCINTNFNINFDTSMYNSYKSVNSTERKNTKLSEEFVNYYLINSVEDHKDLIFYNGEEGMKYDENYKCYYSLDHKSRIIYIKPSPKLLSSLSSIFNSKLISKKTTKNISNEESGISQTPQKETNLDNDVNMLNFDHNKIIEKLKNLELMRKDTDSNFVKNKSDSGEEEESREIDKND